MCSRSYLNLADVSNKTKFFHVDATPLCRTSASFFLSSSRILGASFSKYFSICLLNHNLKNKIIVLKYSIILFDSKWIIDIHINSIWLIPFKDDIPLCDYAISCMTNFLMTCVYICIHISLILIIILLLKVCLFAFPLVFTLPWSKSTN